MQTLGQQAAPIQSRNRSLSCDEPETRSGPGFSMLCARYNQLPGGWATKEMVMMEPTRLRHPFPSSS